MAGITHHMQGHVAAVGAAPAVRWYATDGITTDGFATASRKRHLVATSPKNANTEVKPSHGGPRRVLEGSS